MYRTVRIVCAAPKEAAAAAAGKRDLNQIQKIPESSTEDTRIKYKRDLNQIQKRPESSTKET